MAVTKWFGDAPGFIFPWATDYLGDAELPEVLDSTNGIEVEKVAGLAPDLIIGQYAGITEKEYELLSKIAPTVAQSGDYADYGMPWDEMALNIGTAVGQPEKMQGVIDDVKDQIAQAAADHPEFEGKTAAVMHAVRRAVRLRARGPAVADAGGPRLHVPRDPRERRRRVRRVDQLRAHLRPRPGRRRGLARPRGRPAGEEDLRADQRPRRRAAGSTSARPTAPTTWRTAS